MKAQPQLRQPANDVENSPAGRPAAGPLSVNQLLSWADAIAWDPALTPAAKALAHLIRSCVDRKSGRAYFGDEFGTLHTGKKRRSLSRARHELVSAGYLVTWRPSRTMATEYFPQMQQANEFLAELKDERESLRRARASDRSKSDIDDDEIPF